LGGKGKEEEEEKEEKPKGSKMLANGHQTIHPKMLIYLFPSNLRKGGEIKEWQWMAPS
jgi:hypothetical protein